MNSQGKANLFTMNYVNITTYKGFDGKWWEMHTSCWQMSHRKCAMPWSQEMKMKFQAAFKAIDTNKSGSGRTCYIWLVVCQTRCWFDIKIYTSYAVIRWWYCLIPWNPMESPCISNVFQVFCQASSNATSWRQCWRRWVWLWARSRWGAFSRLLTWTVLGLQDPKHGSVHSYRKTQKRWSRMWRKATPKRPL